MKNETEIEYPAVHITWYDSFRKIVITAPDSTGDEWTALITAMKIAIGVFLENDE